MTGTGGEPGATARSEPAGPGTPPRVRVVGAGGRAGGALTLALRSRGWPVDTWPRPEPLAAAAIGVDLLVLAVPDGVLAAVAAEVHPAPGTVVAHLAGSQGLDVLAPHPRRASLHPLVALPSAEVGAERLEGAWYAVAGSDPGAEALVEAVARLLGGRTFVVADEHRAAYHAAAAIAANHLVGLLGQVERVATGIGVPLAAYVDLARAALENVAALGPTAALTGPVTRGDEATLQRHRDALPPEEIEGYDAGVALARRVHAQRQGAPGTPVGGAGGPRPGPDTSERREAGAAHDAGVPAPATGRTSTMPDETQAPSPSGPADAGGGRPVVVHTIAEFRALLDAARTQGRRVGLVPTMGALHEGHASLIRASAADNDVTALTVFVNPLQFAPTEDLARYPRTLDADVDLAGEAGATVVFAPPDEEMYPHRPVLTSVSVAELSAPMEGAARPTHFAGVATVVAKLFAIAGPCRAYFGEKDFQQLAVVRRMAADLSFPVEVIGCPTVREPDGLAMSSRNRYLDAEHRAAAVALSAALRAGVALIEGGERSAANVRAAMERVIDAEPLLELDYAQVVDVATLEGVDPLAGELRLLVAARCGAARLIDNMGCRA